MTKARKQYSSDLSDGEWRVMRRVIPKQTGAGRKMEFLLREVLNAIFYILRTGCQWRDMPGDFPNWQSVYYHYYKWVKRGEWRRLNALMCRLERQHRARQPCGLSVLSPRRWVGGALLPRRALRGWDTVRVSR
jgi:putative transposase